MNSAIERILGLRVKDVMNEEVLTVSESDGMRAAAQRIFDSAVTGAPVVNSEGECVGVLSASDFVGRDAGRHSLQIMTQEGPGESHAVESLQDDVVSAHMSPVVQSISGDATILTAARIMCNEGIHRLVVFDEGRRPVGIVTTLDLVAAIVAAIEE